MDSHVDERNHQGKSSCRRRCSYGDDAMFLLLWCNLTLGGSSMVASSPTPGAANNNASTTPPHRCFPAIFSFGDSLTDTGNAESAFPARFFAGDRFPYGMSYFPSPSDRYSDGRLFIDFAAQAAGLPFLSPYLRSVGSNFESGANFAVVGSTALNNTFITPFHLGVQMDWFRKFKRDVNQALSAGITHHVPDVTHFTDGLYVIASGGNDIIFGLSSTPFVNASLDYLQTILPMLVNRTVEVVQDLYAEGARRFFIQNIPPTGCNPATLTMFPSPYLEYDLYGCIRPINTILETYGYLLNSAITQLRRSLVDGVFIYGDYYRVIYTMLEDHVAYGFNQTTQNCCGVGGYYNFNMLIRCGESGMLDGQSVKAMPCSNPSSYMFWDGIHFTEAVNRIVAQQFFRGLFIDPPDAWTNLCQFDMSVIEHA